MKDILLLIREMLAAGRINEKDRDLVNRTPESAITDGQVLALRDGKPFQP